MPLPTPARIGMPRARPSEPPPGRVLITGAGSGLGAELARIYLARGARVLLTDLAETPPAGWAGAAYPGTAAYRRVDVRSETDWAAARDWLRQEWGGLDLLVNNAGVGASGRIELLPADEWRWLLDINLMGVVHGCAAFVPLLKEQGRGRIVNIASVAGLCHAPGLASYNVAKAGVVALSETLLSELAPYGVGVSVVCPYFFRSGLADSLPGSDPAMAPEARHHIDDAPRSAQWVATRVVAGIDAGRAMILPDRSAQFFWWGKRYAAPAYRLVMGRLGRDLARSARGADQAGQLG